MTADDLRDDQIRSAPVDEVTRKAALHRSSSPWLQVDRQQARARIAAAWNARLGDES